MRRNINMEVLKKGRGREIEKRVWVIGKKNSELRSSSLRSHLPASAAWTSWLVIHSFTHSVSQCLGSTQILGTQPCAVFVMLINSLLSLTSSSSHLVFLATPLELLREETFLARESHAGKGRAVWESLFLSGNTESVHLRSEAPGAEVVAVGAGGRIAGDRAGDPVRNLGEV